ncbi:MAG: hypothetical protein AAGC93_23945 [Cyanobacteria bacterium P01_F01_bin.53]
MLSAIDIQQCCKGLWQKVMLVPQKLTHWRENFESECDAWIPFGRPMHPQGATVRSKCCAPIPDGCTGVPDFDFKDVCDRHDLDYAAGGTEDDRLRADQVLKQGILERGHPILARVYFVGVRVLGRRAFCFHEAGYSLCDGYELQGLATDPLDGSAA